MAASEKLAELIQDVYSYFGSEYKQKLLFVPDADNKPDVHEISEAVLFRFLLNEETLKEFKGSEVIISDKLDVLKDIDKNSKIAEFETHKSSMDMITNLKGRLVHVFIVFKSTSETDGDYWWSLEKGVEYIFLQRSRNKENVKDKWNGVPRNEVEPIVENLKGKGTIKDLFAVLWAQKMIPEKYNILNSNCQSFVTFVSQQMTQEEYQYKGIMIPKFSFSPPRGSGRDKKMLDLINILRGSSDWPPLFIVIQMENADLVDKMIDSGKYDINAFYDKLTPLHFAIMFSKTKMVQHLLKHPMNADPTTHNASRKNVLHLATMYTTKAEIFDLLLTHLKVKVDDVDEEGRTALHSAARVSNVVAVRKLIENGANPNIIDNNGMSPLHVAAQERDGNAIIDLLLEAKKVKGLGDVNDRNERGETALHYAAIASNEIKAEHLIKHGADPNCRNNYGHTPLHMAAVCAENLKIIYLLLLKIKKEDIGQYINDKQLILNAMRNVHGLSAEIGVRLLEKGIITPSKPIVDKATGVNTRRFVDKGAHPSTDLLGFYHNRIAEAENPPEIDEILREHKLDINGHDQNGLTLLLVAILANDVEMARCLLEKGADPAIRYKNFLTPFHLASAIAEDCDILNLLLANERVDINETAPTSGMTALHLSTYFSNLIAVCFLLSNGANPNVADKDGATPLHWAAWYATDMEIVQLLINHQATNVYCIDKGGCSALDYARENKRRGMGEGIANLLREKGAVETENELPKGSNEILKKHMRVYSNRMSDEAETFLSDDTISTGEKFDRILKESLISAIKDSDVESVSLLLKNGASAQTWGEMGEKALHWAAAYAKTTDVIDAILKTGEFDINGVDNNGWTPLHCAITTENMTTARYLLEKGADPNIANKNGVTPLHFAATRAKEIETINLLLENELVDINQIDKDGWTALHYAIKGKNVQMVRYLLEKGADPTIFDNDGFTPFHLAALILTDSAVLGLMLLGNEKKIEIDERNKNGHTALHLVIMSHNVDAADFLLSNGANPNAANQHGFTPLHFAVYFASDMDIVKLLVNHKDTNVNYLDNKGNDALHYAMINGHGCGRAIAKLLKRKGVVEEIIGQDDLLDECKGGDGNNDSMVKEVPNEAIVHPDVELHRILIEIGIDACKTTPLLKVGGGINNLHHVLSSCLKVWESININAIEILDVILASAGEFDINIRDEEGMTPLHYAITENTVEMVRYLLKKGADPTIRNNEGNNSFHLAVLFLTDTDVLDLMLGNENKIEIDERNKKGKTALHMAVMDSNTAAAKFLLSNGANPNVADEHGVTPLHVAAKYAKGMDIVELLLNRHGVDVNCFDNLGYNALAYAKYNDHGLSEAIGNLLRAKMDASAEGSNYKPKNIAAWVDSDMETIRFLIENGQDVSAMTWGENGANALHLAAANEKTTDLIDIILVSRQCNINSVDSDGRTPLHYAIKRPDPVTINARRLIKMGADPGIADKNGVTPLHMAARNAETMDLIEILLNTGTLDVNCVDKQGRTPLDCARGNKHGLGEKIINRLRE